MTRKNLIMTPTNKKSLTGWAVGDSLMMRDWRTCMPDKWCCPSQNAAGVNFKDDCILSFNDSGEHSGTVVMITNRPVPLEELLRHRGISSHDTAGNTAPNRPLQDNLPLPPPIFDPHSNRENDTSAAVATTDIFKFDWNDNSSIADGVTRSIYPTLKTNVSSDDSVNSKEKKVNNRLMGKLEDKNVASVSNSYGDFLSDSRRFLEDDDDDDEDNSYPFRTKKVFYFEAKGSGMTRIGLIPGSFHPLTKKLPYPNLLHSCEASLSHAPMIPHDYLPGDVPGSVGLGWDGRLLVSGRQTKWTEKFGSFDVMGCAWEIGGEGRVFFTRNGRLIDRPVVFDRKDREGRGDGSEPMYPVIGLSGGNGKVIGNLGCSEEPFAWNWAENLRVIQPLITNKKEAKMRESTIASPVTMVKGRYTNIEVQNRKNISQEMTEAATIPHDYRPSLSKYFDHVPSQDISLLLASEVSPRHGSESVVESLIQNSKEIAQEIQNLTLDSINPKILIGYGQSLKEEIRTILMNKRELEKNQFNQTLFSAYEALDHALKSKKCTISPKDLKDPPAKDELRSSTNREAISALFLNKDVYGLIYLLHSSSIDRPAVVNAIMTHAKNEPVICNHLRSYGGLLLLFAFFRQSTDRRLRLMIALTIAYTVPSSTEPMYYCRESLVSSIVDCLNFLWNDGDWEGIGVTGQEVREVVARAMTFLWINEFKPLWSESGDTVWGKADNSSGGVSKHVVLKSNDGTHSKVIIGEGTKTSKPDGESHEMQKYQPQIQRLQDNGLMKKLLKITVHFIIRIASSITKNSLPFVKLSSKQYEHKQDIAITVESLCTINFARPSAINSGILGVLCSWIASSDPTLIIAAINALRNLSNPIDEYTCGWVHSRILIIEGSIIPLIVTLAVCDNFHIRRSVANILRDWSTTGGLSMRLAMIKADAVGYLVRLLLDALRDVDGDREMINEQLALAAGQAIMGLAENNKDNDESAEKVIIQDLVDGGVVEALVNMTQIPHTRRLQLMRTEFFRIISKDIGMINILSDTGVVAVLGKVLRGNISHLFERLHQASDDDFALSLLFQSLEALANILDPGTTQVMHQRDNARAFPQSYIGMQTAHSGGLETLLLMASLPVSATIISPFNGRKGSIDNTHAFLIESFRCLASICPYLTAPNAGFAKWTGNVVFTLMGVLKRESTEASQESVLRQLKMFALKGLCSLAEFEPLKMTIVDDVLPELFRIKNDDRECADRGMKQRAEHVCLTLGFSEEEIDVHLTGNDLHLAAEIFCLRRNTYLVAMVRDEIINALYSIWSEPLKMSGVEVVEDFYDTHDQNKKMKPVNIQHRVSLLQHIFPRLTRDKKVASHRETMLEQYSSIHEERKNIFSDDNIASAGTVAPNADDHYNERSAFSNNDELSVSPGFPSTGLADGLLPGVVLYEMEWMLGHRNAMIATDENERRRGTHYADETLPMRVKHILQYYFVSPLLQHEILPLYDFRTDAVFECFNLYLPSQVYYSFRIGSQVLSRLCELCPKIDDFPNTVTFANSYFRGEFAESFVAALYRCPKIKGVTFSRAGQFPAPKWDDTNAFYGGDDNEAEHLAYLTGNIPPWITILAFDNMLSQQGVAGIVEALKIRGQRGSLNINKDNAISRQQLGDLAAQVQSDDHCSDVSPLQILAITHSSNLGPKSFCPLIDLLGFPDKSIQSRLNRPPLSLLKVLDLSGNKLGDETCAYVLSIVYRESSRCSLERLGLSGNDLGTADQVLAVLTNHVKQYGEAIWSKSLCDDGNYHSDELWRSPLTKLDLSQNNLSESTTAQILSLVKGDALKLQSLNLAKNGLTGDGKGCFLLDRVVDVIFSKSNDIVELNLSGNHVSHSFVDALIRKLSCHRVCEGSTLAFLHMHENTPPLTKTHLDGLHSFLVSSRTEKLRRHFRSRSKPDDKNATNSSSNDLSVDDCLQFDELEELDEYEILKHLDLEIYDNSKDSEVASGSPDGDLLIPPKAANRTQSSTLGFSAKTFSSLQRTNIQTGSNLAHLPPLDQLTTKSLDTVNSESTQSSILCSSPESVDNVSKMTHVTNEITVLYSEPLAWLDTRTKSYLPITMLDFESERELLMQCFEEARKNIKLCLYNATLDQLQAAARRTCNCLHFSGHGHPNSLVFEDGRGGLSHLNTDQIKDIISSSVNDGVVPFKLVFVSACHSGITGETFVKAGIPHVVCCQQESQLMDFAALAFTRAFYLALALGRTVKDSFEIGCQAVLVTPSVPNCESEMKKFLLLPKDGNHDQPIFNARPVYKWPVRTPSSGMSQSLSSTFSGYNRDDPTNLPIPNPPQGFLGREVDMYHALNAVLNHRLVSVIGEPGIGRGSMVSALCQYISDRKNTMIAIDQIFYVRTTLARKKESVCFFITSLHKLLVSANMASPLPKGADSFEFFPVITKALSKTKALIVFDKTEKLEGFVETQEFLLFLNTLFLETKHVRVLMTSCKKLNVSSLGDVEEQVLTLGPLNFKNTVRLFGILCPHLHTGEGRIGLLKLLVLNETQGGMFLYDKRMTARSRVILKRLGDGIPAKIFEIAYEMSRENFEALIKVARNTNDNMSYSDLSLYNKENLPAKT